jgi:anthranilate/para-aminobenzoate synthase component I
MPNLKLAFAKRQLKQSESVPALFECVRARAGFLLQSGAGSPVQDGRYSYIGYDPFARGSSSKGVTQLLKLKDFSDWKKSASVQIIEGEPLKVLRDLMRHFSMNAKAPVPFCGGMAGYFSYDFGARLMGLEQKVFDDLELPDFVVFFADKLLAVDHERAQLYLIALAPTDSEVERKLAGMENDLRVPASFVQAGTVGEISSDLNFDQYSRKFETISKYLKEGNTCRVNFSQRFSGEVTRDPWLVYKDLQRRNPAPYGCYFDCGDFQILSVSPELLLRKKGATVLTQPVKAAVPEQITAGNETLMPGKDFFDVFRVLFPGGFSADCPKKRTMEIIDGAEDFKRGVYTGSAGYAGFDGDGVMNILIRTMLLQDKKFYYQAGGDIVTGLDARTEYRKILDEARAFQQACLPDAARRQKR